MRFIEYCLLEGHQINEAKCIEIIAELWELKTEEHIKEIRKKFNLTNKEMLEICEKCPNYDNKE